MKTINIKAIRIDGGTQSRVEINNEIVAEYAALIKAGTEFPSVIVFYDGVDTWLADGFHRFHAHNQADKASIAVDIRPGTVRHAKLYSFGANGRHGQRPTNADKRKSVSEMLADSEWVTWSQHKIAETCGVSAGFVSKMVNEAASIHGEQIKPATRTVERNGKTYEQNTANIGKPPPQATLPITTPAKPAPEAPQVEPEPEAPADYTELDAVHDQISELQNDLAVARMNDATDEDKQQAAALIAELRAEIKTLSATLKSTFNSRDALMEENSQMKTQMKMQRKEIAQLKVRRAEAGLQVSQMFDAVDRRLDLL